MSAPNTARTELAQAVNCVPLMVERLNVKPREAIDRPLNNLYIVKATNTELDQIIVDALVHGMLL